MSINPNDLDNLRLYLCYVACTAVDKLIDEVRISGEIPTGQYVLEMELTTDRLEKVMEEAEELRRTAANGFMVSPDDLERMFRDQNASDQ